MKYEMNEVKNLAICIRKENGFLSIFGTAYGLPGAFRVMDHAADCGFERCLVIDMDKYGVNEKQLRTVFRCMEDIGVCSLFPYLDEYDDTEEYEIKSRPYCRVMYREGGNK